MQKGTNSSLPKKTRCQRRNGTKLFTLPHHNFVNTNTNINKTHKRTILTRTKRCPSTITSTIFTPHSSQQQRFSTTKSIVASNGSELTVSSSASQTTSIPTTKPVPQPDLQKAKNTPVYMRDDPASLEYYHFSNPKWRKSQPNQFLNQKDPFQLMLNHPVGQVLISQWIGNHLSLHLQHVINHPENQFKTKHGNLLVGYDINSEYAKDVDAVPIDLDQDDPRHVNNRTKLITSAHDNIDWDNITMVDYGYVAFDPAKPSYRKLKKKFDKALDKHLEWAKLCGVGEKDALKQELLYREQFRHVDKADPAQIFAATAQRLKKNSDGSNALLIEGENGENSKDKLPAIGSSLSIDVGDPTTTTSTPQQQRQSTPPPKTKLRDMTLPQQSAAIGKMLGKVAVGSVYLTYTVLSRTTQILFPGGAQELYRAHLSHITPRYIALKFYALFRTIAISAIRGLRNIYLRTNSAFKAKLPFLHRHFKKQVYRMSDQVVNVASPILSGVQTTNVRVNKFASFVDEWLGTEYSSNPKLKQFNSMTKFEVLLEFAPHPGNPPELPKASPYQDQIPPSQLFASIKPNRHGSTMEDVLHAAEIDDHRLLLSYIDRLRNTSPISLGLCPDEMVLPEDYFKPKMNEKGMLEVPLTHAPPTPELLLMTTDAKTVYEQAGLRKHPDIWLSKRILDKIPAPDFVDLGLKIQQIDPTFTPPVTLNRCGQETTSTSLGREIAKGIAFGFLCGGIGYEGYLIYQELMNAFAQFPDAPRGELVQDFVKFYGLRMKYSTTAILDATYHQLTNKHLFQRYDGVANSNQDYVDQFNRELAGLIGDQTNQPPQRHPRRQVQRFNEEELHELLRQVEVQMAQQSQAGDGKSPEFTMLTKDQADALIQFNQQSQQSHQGQTLQSSLEQQLGGLREIVSLSNNHAEGIEHFADEQRRLQQPTRREIPLYFQSLSPEEIAAIENENPNLKAQVDHAFGISKQDLIDMEKVTTEMAQKHETL